MNNIIVKKCIDSPSLSLSHTHTVDRSADIPTRQRYVRLVESVKESGGTVRIFSSLHVSGERKIQHYACS